MASNTRIKATISLIIAILIVSVYTFFGMEKSVTVELDSCGNALIKDKFIEIHSNCRIQIETGTIPKVEIENNRLKLTIPEGWKWRIVPK